MREVLISIQPKWVEKIASGEKTVEVRKTRPKLETPFKCYIYCTMPKNKHDNLVLTPFGYDVGAEWAYCNYQGNHNGKVIGEFVCDKIEDYTNYSICLQIGSAERRKELLEKSCLTLDEWKEYIGYDLEQFGFAWHISDLVIYDEPRELCEFFQVKAIRGYHKKDEPKTDGINIPRLLNSTRFEVNFLTRPPQSWCYIETRQTAD